MNNEEVIVRFCKEDEWEQINRIRKEVHVLHTGHRPDFFKEEGWDAIRDLVKVRFSSDHEDVVVALLEDRIVGFAIVQYVSIQESPFRPGRDICHIEEFGVAEDYRRRGVATKLIDFIKKDASQRGLKKLELNMWEFNESAFAFYDSVGFGAYRKDLELFLDEPDNGAASV